MADGIVIVIPGLEKLVANFERLKEDIQNSLGAAGKEAANEVLDTQGLRKYPTQIIGMKQPFKTDKSRRYFFWALKEGEITYPYSRGGGKSQRYGTQFYVSTNRFITTIGNRASYNVYLGGPDQSKHMAARGWRKLFDVAREKVPEITRIYQGWVDRLIRKNNL